MPKQAMLMAAGLGTRLKPFTENEPKAFLPVMGVPAAQFALDALNAAGVERVAVNIHHHPGKARAYLQGLQTSAQVLVSDESALLLGSAGGLRSGLELLRPEAFFLVNADVITDFSLAKLAAKHRELRSRWDVDLTLTVFPGNCAPPDGIYREIRFDAQTGLMTELVDELRPQVPFFMGSAIIEPSAIAHLKPGIPAEFIPEVLLPALRRKKVGVFFSQGLWLDIGSPALWWEAHMRLLAGMETGDVPWMLRQRIEKRYQRLGTEIWVRKKRARFLDRTQWFGPLFLDVIRGAEMKFPRILGPEAVIYGGLPRQEVIQRGIAYGGAWVPIPPVTGQSKR